jgi:hypothetical protein
MDEEVIRLSETQGSKQGFFIFRLGDHVWIKHRTPPNSGKVKDGTFTGSKSREGSFSVAYDIELDADGELVRGVPELNLEKL